MMKFEGHISRMGETRNDYRIFIGNPGEKRSL
jgi:hypothetical protein